MRLSFACVTGRAVLTASLATLFLAGSPVLAAAIKDAEAASHDDTAAMPTFVKSYAFTGVKILQYNLAVLSHYSYFVVSGTEALVVDPARDVQAYLDIAQKEGWTIKGVFLTHSHADFVAGHSELAKAAGCPVFQNKESGAHYTITALSDQQTLPWGEATLQFLSTPGHTPDGMCALVFDKASKTTPCAVLTGDTLFVGSIGRPDLMGGAMAASTLAGMSYDTWKNKLSKLADSVIVLPAHGAGSLCGAHLRDEPSSTIGTERATNPYLQHTSRNDFITAVLEGLPEAPQYFKHNAKMNQQGPPLVAWNAPLPPLPAYFIARDLLANEITIARAATFSAAGTAAAAVTFALAAAAFAFPAAVAAAAAAATFALPAAIAATFLFAQRSTFRIAAVTRLIQLARCCQRGSCAQRDEHRDCDQQWNSIHFDTSFLWG